MAIILAAVLPVMLMVVLGYVFARSGRPVEGESLRFVIVHVGTPTLVFTALLKNDLSGAALAGYAGAAVLALALFALVGWSVLRLNRWPVRSFLPSLMFANTGNLGLPLALYASGPTALGYAAVLHSVATVGNLTIGQSIAVGRMDVRSVLRSPVIMATLLGLAVAQFHVSLPLWLKNTLELPGGFTIPLMLLMLGSSLATIEVHSIGRTVALSALRIGMGTAIGFALAWAFGMSGVPRVIFILQAAMPAAVYNYLFAVIGKTDPAGVASVVVVSTLMAAITIPVLLAVLL